MSVQGTLRDAITRVTGEVVLPQGSGRTDTGVHALGQVASFCTRGAYSRNKPGARAEPHTGLPAITCLNCSAHACRVSTRGTARLAKTYEYRIFRGDICPPWQSPLCLCAVLTRLDQGRDGASSREHSVGEHDFQLRLHCQRPGPQ